MSYQLSYRGLQRAKYSEWIRVTNTVFAFQPVPAKIETKPFMKNLFAKISQEFYVRRWDI